MATLMDMIMAQRGDQSDPRFNANQQAMELQGMASGAAPTRMPPPAFAGGLSPFAAPQRAPMMMSAPPLAPQMMSPFALAGQPPAYSGYGGMDSPRERIAMAAGMPAATMPPPRPAMPAPVGAPMQLASAAPVRESFMQRLLGGPNYQSNNMPVAPQGGAQAVGDINWGDPDNAADFFRAEQALRGLLG